MKKLLWIICTLALVILGGIILYLTFIFNNDYTEPFDPTERLPCLRDKNRPDDCNYRLERDPLFPKPTVSLPIYTATVELGTSYLFNIDILNIQTPNEFHMLVEPSRVLNSEEEDITPSVDKKKLQEWISYNEETFFINQNESRKEAILITVSPNTNIGEIVIFNAKVFLESGEQYGNTQKFIVTVK